jgi:hypothetical protein
LVILLQLQVLASLQRHYLHPASAFFSSSKAAELCLLLQPRWYLRLLGLLLVDMPVPPLELHQRH